MKENSVEQRLRMRLQKHGFLVLKLTTPGYNGAMDRMILWPKGTKKPPVFIEVKRPGEKPRRLQEVCASDWQARGARVEPFVSDYLSVDALVDKLIGEL